MSDLMVPFAIAVVLLAFVPMVVGDYQFATWMISMATFITCVSIYWAVAS